MELINKKILFFSHNLNGGEGAPYSLWELCAGLKSRYKISPIVMSPEHGSLEKNYESADIPVIIDPAYASLAQIEDHEKITGDNVPLLKKVFQKLSVDAVIANTFLTYHAVNAAMLNDIPALWIIRESIDPVEQFAKYLPGYSRQLFDNALNSSQNIVFVSNTTRERWQKILNIAPDKITIIHNGLNLNRFSKSSLPSKMELRSELCIDPDKIMLLSVGTICYRKNQKQILDALLLLPEKALNMLEMIFVGDHKENYAREFRKTLEDHPKLSSCVKMFDPTPAIDKFYRAADAFVFTSLSESYPRVILEALFFSLPVITTDVFGVKEQTRNGESALYYNQDKTETLAARILQILSPKLRNALSTGARKQFEQLTSYDEMVDRYAELLAKSLLVSKTGVGED